MNGKSRVGRVMPYAPQEPVRGPPSAGRVGTYLARAPSAAGKAHPPGRKGAAGPPKVRGGHETRPGTSHFGENTAQYPAGFVLRTDGEAVQFSGGMASAYLTPMRFRERIAAPGSGVLARSGLGE